jgi:hypothetical protein
VFTLPGCRAVTHRHKQSHVVCVQDQRSPDDVAVVRIPGRPAARFDLHSDAQLIVKRIDLVVDLRDSVFAEQNRLKIFAAFVLPLSTA